MGIDFNACGLCVLTLTISGLTSAALAQAPSLVVSPASGGLGTVITLQVSPQTPGFELDSCRTTVRWSGVYQPPFGTASTPFTVDYVDADLSIVDPWTAKILIGGGQITSAPNVEGLMGGGSLVGSITATTRPVCMGDANDDQVVNFPDITAVTSNWLADYTQTPCGTGPGDANNDGIVNFDDTTAVAANWGATCSDIALTSAFSFALNTDAATFFFIEYPDSPFGLDPPQLGAEATEIFIHMNSLFPNPLQPSNAQILGATDSHLAVVVTAEENSQSSAGPATITVDVITLNSAGAEVDRLSGLVLTRLANDGDPTKILYVSDLAEPVVVVDVAITDESLLPGFRLIVGENAGKVVVVPNASP